VPPTDLGPASAGDVGAPALEHLYDLTVDLEAPCQIGDVGRGGRLIIPVRSGTLTGPRLRGKVLPPSADWLTVRTDGTGELDVRATVETDDGALIYAAYRGYVTNVPAIMPRWAAGEAIPPDEYYFRTTPYFETGAPRYAWLTRIVAVGVGALIPGGVSFRVFAVK
jgi:hypothetical protein